MNYFKIAIIVLLLFFSFPSFTFAAIYINEFSSSASKSEDPDWPDWIEVFNSGPDTVDLSEFKLRDSSATNKLSLAGIIQSNEFMVFEWGNKLNNSGDTIRLVRIIDEAILDEIVYGEDRLPSPNIGQTGGRENDGGENWVIFEKGSKGTSNNQTEKLPTPTSTPTPTIKPTSTPKPSPTPKPSKASSPTPLKTSTALKTNPTEAELTFARKVYKDEEIERTVSKSILGENVASVSPALTPKKPSPTKEIKIAGENKTFFPPLFFALGVILLTVSGIIAFRSFRKRDET